MTAAPAATISLVCNYLLNDKLEIDISRQCHKNSVNAAIAFLQYTEKDEGNNLEHTVFNKLCDVELLAMLKADVLMFPSSPSITSCSYQNVKRFCSCLEVSIGTTLSTIPNCNCSCMNFRKCLMKFILNQKRQEKLRLLQTQVNIRKKVLKQKRNILFTKGQKQQPLSKIVLLKISIQTPRHQLFLHIFYTLLFLHINSILHTDMPITLRS